MKRLLPVLVVLAGSGGGLQWLGPARQTQGRSCACQGSCRTPPRRVACPRRARRNCPTSSSEWGRRSGYFLQRCTYFLACNAFASFGPVTELGVEIDHVDPTTYRNTVWPRYCRPCTPASAPRPTRLVSHRRSCTPTRSTAARRSCSAPATSPSVSRRTRSNRRLGDLEVVAPSTGS